MTAAADRLGVTQSPVSQAIKRLENHVGARLINRLPSGVTPTPEGRRLLPQVRVLVRDAAALAATASRISEGTQQLRLGLVSSMPVSLCHSLTAGLHGHCPVETTVGTSDQLVDAVSMMEIDVAVVEDPCPTADLLRGQLHDIPRLFAGLDARPTRWAALSDLPDGVLLDNTRTVSPAAADRLEDSLFALGIDLRPQSWDSPADFSSRLGAPGTVALVPPDLAALWPSVPAPRSLSMRLRCVVHPERTRAGNETEGIDLRATVDRMLRSRVGIQ